MTAFQLKPYLQKQVVAKFGQEAVVCSPLVYIIITSKSLEFNIIPLKPQLLIPLMTMVILKVSGVRILASPRAILLQCIGTFVWEFSFQQATQMISCGQALWVHTARIPDLLKRHGPGKEQKLGWRSRTGSPSKIL